MTLYDWLKSVAAAVNDHEPGREFHRYGIDSYMAAYNAAMGLVAKYRGEDFIELTKVKLQDGRHQDARLCCSNIIDVLEQINSKGSTIKSLAGAAKMKVNKWRKPSCVTNTTAVAAAGSGGYVMTSATIDTQMNGRFTVEPPVPCGVSVYVLVKCVKKFPRPTAADAKLLVIDESSIQYTAAWHYMLARMLSGDRHAGSADATSTIHYKMFFEILGIVMRQEDLLEAKK